MRYLVCTTITALALSACGGGKASESSATSSAGEPASGSESGSQGETSSGGDSADSSDADVPTSNGDGTNRAEFVVRKSDPKAKKEDEGKQPESHIKGNAREAAMKFIVVDKEKGPIRGIIISMPAPDGKKYYTEETNAEGYAEVLVPVGQKYELVYLSLGRKDVAASVPVSDEPNQNVRLTLRYKRWVNPAPKIASNPGVPPAPPGLVLEGITFDTGKATIRDESFAQLDNVAEFMTLRKNARIEISGHTDNVGNPKANKTLSQKRADACREYLMIKGVEEDRIQAVGYGDERPIASNDTEEGRQKNRRIEATEL